MKRTINAKPILTALSTLTGAIRKGRHNGRSQTCSCDVCWQLDTEALEAIDFLENMLIWMKAGPKAK